MWSGIWKMRVLVVIPAYNEEESIVRVVENLKQNYEQLDYVIINDGSKDHTAQICRENGYQLVNLPTNLGLAGAVQAGMKYALCHGYNAAIQFDADGQHRPCLLYTSLAYNRGREILAGCIDRRAAEECVVHAGWLYLSCKAGRKDHARMVRHGK